jgi:outer membrane protein assembly factor BamD
MFRMLVLSCALAALPTLAHAAEPQTIELRGGQYWQTLPKAATAPVTDETLDRVGQLIENNSNTAAKKLVLAWIKSRPKDHPLRDRALYLLGLANYQYGDRIASFYNFDELMDKYPDSKYFYPALDKQYQIADAFLGGYKRRFMGIPFLSGDDEAVEMMFRIQQRSPGSPLAEKALKRTADYYYADGQYDLAVDAYQAFIDRYKRSPDVPETRLKKAFALLAQFTGSRFDATPVINAKIELQSVQQDYPELARQQNLASVIDRIDSALARKSLQTADFYVRTHQPKAAAIHLRQVFESYPNTPEADRARQRFAQLPESARQAAEELTLQTAPPATGPGPSTAPVLRAPGPQ